MLNLSRKAHIAIISVVSALLFLPFLGAVHLFDWDEINFAECAREMIASGDYTNVKFNFQPFWEKPPVFIWMQVLSMKLFGVNEFAARFPNAVCGIVTLLSIYTIGSKTFNNKFGFLWALAYAGSLLPFLYFKSGIIDPWFNLFIFLGIYQAVLHTNIPSGKTAALSAFFIGMATLTKGPAAVLIFGLCALVYMIRKRFAKVTEIKYVLIFITVFLLSAGSWFLYEIAIGNFQIVKDFFEYQVRLFKTKDAGHGGFFGYHFVVLFFGCFPASVFMIRALKKSGSDTPFQKHFKSWIINLFFVVLILFSIVETKIVHYSSLCYFPLTWLAAYGITKITDREFSWKKWMTYSLVLIILVLGLFLSVIPFIEKLKSVLIKAGLIDDKFAIDALSVAAGWQGWEFIVGLVFLFGGLFILLSIVKERYKNIPALFALTSVTTFMALLFIAPRIEVYTQRPAIEFYQQLQSKHCYVETINFKSYAPLFYGNRQAYDYNPSQLKYINFQMSEAIRTKGEVFTFSLWSTNWLMSLNIDRPAYFVVKSPDEAQFKSDHPSFVRLYKKGGFVFFRRDPPLPH